MVVRILKRVRNFALLMRNHAYDARRYFASAASNARPMDDDQLRARLFQKAHSIEKGLSLPDVRGGFGAAALTELRQLIAEYDRRGLDGTDPSYAMARFAIAAYVAFHATHGLEIPEKLSFVRGLAADMPDVARGGVEDVDGATMRARARRDFAELVAARRSTRIFADTPVEPESIRAAMRLALRSPSVCNRQSGRATLVTDRALLDRILPVQGGNRGFTDAIPAVLVVTAYLGVFRGARERNQCWIDGGLFAMSLLYALTYVGLGTCPLNWSADAQKDKKLRAIMDIPDNEVVIMMIAVGNLPEQYRVAVSPRRTLEDCFRVVG